MNIFSRTALAFITIFIFSNVAFAAPRTAKEQKVGNAQHPKILAVFGGEIHNPALSRYVTRIGKKITVHTDQANAPWRFTVLDSPIVNAFALPGGYVYISRGLLALANNEAELAGVLGHEIGHVVAQHGLARQKRGNQAGLGVILGTVLGGVLGGSEGAEQAVRIGSQIAAGYQAKYSQKHELEADRLGIQYIIRAGYSPFAQADFLDNMAEKQALEAKIAGQQYNPNQVSFFASHPSTGSRVKQAIAFASSQGMNTNSGKLNEARYMKAINKMVYGDSADQGFVRGRRFSHPKMRFTFEAPKGFRIMNSARQVVAVSKNGSRMILSGVKDKGGKLDAFIRNYWIPIIAKSNRVGRPKSIKRGTINGLNSATAFLPVQTRKGHFMVQLTAIRYNGEIFQLVGMAPRGNKTASKSLSKAIQNFRALSVSEAKKLRPYRVINYKVKRNDSVKGLARQMPASNYRESQFRTMNDLDDGNVMKAGDLVKLIR